MRHASASEVRAEWLHLAQEGLFESEIHLLAWLTDPILLEAMCADQQPDDDWELRFAACARVLREQLPPLSPELSRHSHVRAARWALDAAEARKWRGFD